LLQSHIGKDDFENSQRSPLPRAFRFLNARVLAVFLCLLLAIYQTPDLENLSAATASLLTDDGPVGYSVYHKNPDYFAGDVFGMIGAQSSVASVQNWLPYLLEQNHGLPAIRSAQALVFLQIFVLYVGSLVLGLAVTGSFAIALTYAILLQAFEFWGWNLFHYGSSLHLNLATQLSLGFWMLAAGFALGTHWIRFLLVSFILVYVHPSMFVLLSTWFGISLLVNRFANPKQRQPLIAVTATLVVLLGSYLLVLGHYQRSPVEVLSSHEYFDALSQFSHMFPWNYSDWGRYQLPRFLIAGFVVTAAFLCIRAKLKSWQLISFYSFFATIAVYLLILGTAVSFEVVPLIKLMPLRWSYVFLSVFSIFLVWSAFLVVEWVCEKRKIPAAVQVACFAFIIGGLSLQICRKADNAHAAMGSRENTDWLKAAEFVRDNTPKASRFMLHGRGWRAASLRQAVEPRNLYFYIYNSSKELYEHERKFQKFYGIEHLCKLPYRLEDCENASYTAYMDLSAPKLVELARLSKASHLVLPSNRDVSEAPELVEIYHNHSFKVYQVYKNGSQQ
jgi:hypothetical protein